MIENIAPLVYFPPLPPGFWIRVLFIGMLIEFFAYIWIHSWIKLSLIRDGHPPLALLNLYNKFTSGRTCSAERVKKG